MTRKSLQTGSPPATSPCSSRPRRSPSCAVSIILAASSLVIARQIEYMKNRDLGFDKRQMLILPLRGEGIFKRTFPVMSGPPM